MSCNTREGLCKIPVAHLGVDDDSNAPKSCCSFPYLVSRQVLKDAASEEKPRPLSLPTDAQTRAQEPSMSLIRVESVES